MTHPLINTIENSIKYLVYLGKFWSWILILIIITIFLSFIPPFDSLDYYFCALISLFVSMAGGGVAICIAIKGKRENKPINSVIKTSLVATIIFLLIPLVLITLNAIRIKNCNYLKGFLFYLMGSSAGAIFSMVIGLSCVFFFKRKILSYLSFYIIFLGSFLFDIFLVYINPPIFFFNQFMGYFPGAIYDTSIKIESPYFFFRILTILWIFFFLSLWREFFDPDEYRLKFIVFPVKKYISPVIILLLIIISYYFSGDQEFLIKRSDIQKRLPIKVKTEHFIIHFSGESYSGINHQEIALEHEFYYEILKEFFKGKAPSLIKSYIYSSPKQKMKLIGAKNVHISKPWLREIHLNPFQIGDNVLKHEISHIFAGEFGEGLLKVPANFGIIPKMGIIEGMAVAASFNDEEFSPHEWSAGILQAKEQKGIEKLIDSLEFLSTYAGKGYTLMGSFFRFLKDKYGIDKLIQIYRDEEFEKVYGKNKKDLVSEWQFFLLKSANVQVPHIVEDMAGHHFERPGVLHTICPVEIACLKEDAERFKNVNYFSRAIQVYNKILKFSPDEKDVILEIAKLLIYSGQINMAEKFILKNLQIFRENKYLTAKFLELMGDINIILGNIEKAKKFYEESSIGALSVDEKRGILLKICALKKNPQNWRDIFLYLIFPINFEDRESFLLRKLKKNPENPLLIYLLGRWYFWTKNYKKSIEYLEKINFSEDDEKIIEKERFKTIAKSSFFINDLKKSEEYFKKILPFTYSEGEKNTIDEWIKRVDFKNRKGPH